MVLSTAVTIVLLPVMATVFYIGYIHKRELFERFGFETPETGMILIGSIAGLVVDIPVVVSKRALLNINLGGALIPVIVGGSLLHKKNIGLKRVIPGVAVVAAAAYYFSRLEPELGIVSDFPFFFIPSLAALSMALVMERGGYDSIPYAYSTAVFGVIIGADVIRIPVLVNMGILGSIGGAGMMDLVYLSGLIACMPLILYYHFRTPVGGSRDPLDESLRKLREGDLQDALLNAKKAVRKEIAATRRLLKKNGYAFEEETEENKVFELLSFDRYKREDYFTLMGSKKGGKDFAHKAFYTARLIRSAVRRRVKDLYTALGNRMIAYLIDIGILFVPFVFFFITREVGLAEITQDPMSYPVVLGVLSLFISIQFLYFTVMEWYFGRSIGKMAMGLKVFSDDYTDISFVQSAARNSGRYVDIVLFFYLVSIVLISKGEENRRIGDYLGETKVMKK